MVRIVDPPSFCPNCQSSHVLQWGMLNVDPWSGEGGPAPTLCSDNENYFTAWLAVCNLIWATITRFMCFTTSIMHRTQTTARSTDEWGMISQPNTSSLSKTCLPVFPPPPYLENLMSGKLTHCWSWTQEAFEVKCRVMAEIVSEASLKPMESSSLSKHSLFSWERTE